MEYDLKKWTWNWDSEEDPDPWDPAPPMSDEELARQLEFAKQQVARLEEAGERIPLDYWRLVYPDLEWPDEMRFWHARHEPERVKRLATLRRRFFKPKLRYPERDGE